MKQRSRSQRSYDQLAPFYYAIEQVAFGSELQQSRVALSDSLPPWSRLLLRGDGNG